MKVLNVNHEVCNSQKIVCKKLLINITGSQIIRISFKIMVLYTIPASNPEASNYVFIQFGISWNPLVQNSVMKIQAFGRGY